MKQEIVHSCQYSPANLLYKPSKGFLFLNILLIGESRAGKSSFINRIFNKIATYETGKLESETKKITYYEFFHPDTYKDKTENKMIKNGFGGIRIMDTPGLTKTKNLNSINLIKNKLDKEIDYIHIVFFFMKSQSNIENCIDLLKYIKKKNKEREKKNRKKIPIIFIKNGEELKKGGNGFSFFQQLKNELKKNNVFDLFDDSINKHDEKEINEKNFLDDEENDDKDYYKKYIEGNIIQIHIPSGLNINKIFSTAKEYIIKNNELIASNKLNNDFKYMENSASLLISFFVKEKIYKKSLSKEEKKIYKQLYKEGNEFSKFLSKNCSILYKLESFDILKIIKKENCKGVFFQD